MKKVDLLIIGAGRAGTTSLYQYLCLHNEICFSKLARKINVFLALHPLRVTPKNSGPSQESNRRLIQGTLLRRQCALNAKRTGSHFGPHLGPHLGSPYSLWSLALHGGLAVPPGGDISCGGMAQRACASRVHLSANARPVASESASRRQAPCGN